MKTLFTLVLVAVSFGAIAQRSSSKHVSTDGRHLRIRVDMQEAGHSLHYNRSFDVSEMEKSEVKVLENSIIDSLERAFSEPAVAVTTSHKRDSWSKDKSYKSDYSPAQQASYDEQRIAYSRNSEEKEKMYEFSTEAKANPSFSPSEVSPQSVKVQEDKENGRLWMQYTFMKDGEELIIERTANVVGKSEREKQAIIRDTERSFGIKTVNQ
ncbi:MULTISPECIES: hypothetical protein [unclassified Spirosoma]|uniref:hypothetical protein n=1 Tax=unclassified Spirosoma TaxID=2621999 RepID=UPI00095DE145|nr:MULTISPECIES: hypothetical protein [unclassified Spirosoma]MBN8823303.1 hypothetical protein [Spirosoma sp.]OJW72554.1 MAG: hypothetical protein BGO59_15645 [Spirosoma sp. 48-14]